MHFNNIKNKQNRGNFRLDAAEDAKSKCNKNGIAKLANAIGSIQTLRHLTFVFE